MDRTDCETENENDSSAAEAEGENSEIEPLRKSENGLSSGGNGVDTSRVHIIPAQRKRMVPRFELDADSNWRRTDTASPSSTITSTSSSVSSPLKKKLVFTMSGMMRPKQPRENKLRAFVVFMFFVLVLMISLTYVYHQQHLLKIMQLTVGERIKFYENNRVIQLTNGGKTSVLTGNLGMSLTTTELPRDCHVTSAGTINETACLEWDHLAKMVVLKFYKSDSINCYQVQWESTHEGLALQDCFSLSDSRSETESRTEWYGMGEFIPQLWPLRSFKVNYTNFMTGNVSHDMFGHILEGYWVSSKGVAIMANLSAPLQVTIDEDDNGHLCLLSQPSKTEPYALLRYTLCTAWDVAEVHRRVAQNFRPRPALPPLWESAVENIVWSVKQRFGLTVNDTTLYDFTAEITTSYPSQGSSFFLLDTNWQDVDGDFTFNSQQFSNPKEAIGVLRNRNFKVILKVHPYISTASNSYYDYLDKSYWVKDISGHVPNLVRWDYLKSAVMVDFTNTNASNWFRNSLIKLHRSYNVHGFQFHGGEASSLPLHATFYRPLGVRNRYAKLYNDVGTNPSLLFSVGVASELRSIPAFVELSPRKSNWHLPLGLRSLIPSVLSSGLVGYPFMMTGPVGGYPDVFNEHPDRHLYIRWLQVAIFFPVLQMSVLPSDYDEEVVLIADKMLKLRNMVIMPYLKKAIEESVAKGIPVIRPLWWVAPNATSALDNDSEFLVGNDLLVAPILEFHADDRDIYLPPGDWFDREGSPQKGDKWMYDYRSSWHKVAYFVRAPANNKPKTL
ncbi:hypothetical protein CHUAL_013719 [Chamberlinius hualienensis]